MKSGFPWPKDILVINPGDTWTSAVENAHHRTHTITFTTEESTPSGTVQVWSMKINIAGASTSRSCYYFCCISHRSI